jgi:G6PDH family F420-dependent oxidoreductase
MRIHPAVVAQAAATSAVLLDGHFELGVGTGENLNEHILGDRWPTADERLEMLDEAVDVMRMLWTGEEISHDGTHYTVENARIHTLPAEPPAIVMSAFGPKACDLAARIADGFVSTKPDRGLLQQYRDGGGTGQAQAGLKISWGPDRAQAAELAHHLWRSGGVPGELSQELRSTALFEQATQNVTVESVGESMPCGPDVEPILQAVREFQEAGFDRLYLNQIGDEQEAFFRFFTTELGPALAEIGVTPVPALR